MIWTKISLVSREGGGVRGVSLGGVICKLCTFIINIRLCSDITIQYSLHGFIQGWGTGTSKLEEKLAQQLVGICHKPLFQVFLDVQNACGSIYGERYMEIIKDCGLGTQLRRLLQRFWEDRAVVTKAGMCYVRQLNMGIGVTQGVLVCPTVFNIVVGAVVMAVLLEVCGLQEAHHRLGWVTS